MVALAERAAEHRRLLGEVWAEARLQGIQVPMETRRVVKGVLRAIAAGRCKSSWAAEAKVRLSELSASRRWPRRIWLGMMAVRSFLDAYLEDQRGNTELSEFYSCAAEFWREMMRAA